MRKNLCFRNDGSESSGILSSLGKVGGIEGNTRKRWRSTRKKGRADFSEVCHVAGILELVLMAEADLVYHVIEPFDDVEGIDTNLGIGEVLFCNGDEAIAHVTAEVFYLLALRRRELMEISVDSDAGDLVQDIDDGVCVAVRNTAVEFIEIPSVAPGTPDAGVALEFIDADGFGKFSWQAELDGFKNRLDGALRNAVVPGNFREGDGLRKIQKDGIIES